MNCSIIYILIIVLLISYIIVNNSDNSNHEKNYQNEVNIDSIRFNDSNECNNLLTYLDGYWISQDDFNKASDIDKMILYIDYYNKVGTLIIIINNSVVSNNEYQLYLDDDNIKVSNSILNFKILFKNNKKEKSVWDNKTLVCTLNINSGNIKLFNHKDKILFGDFIKDNIISNYINQ